VGISASVLEENQPYITSWLKQALSNGMLDEVDPSNRLRPEGSVDSGYGGSSQSYTPSLLSIADANEEFENELARIPSRTSQSSRSSMSKQPIKVRKASSVSAMVFKLFKKDTAIIEAASEGDVAKVAKLISVGADVNARDRWGVSSCIPPPCKLLTTGKWSALSMCGYGGHVEIARMLLDHGADLDNRDVDGDTPESLATNRGHADIVIMLEEERAARDLKTREADQEKPRP